MFQVFQLRQNGKVDFYRTWDEYRLGFGDVTGEYWLGNDNLHTLTKNHDQMVLLRLRNGYGDWRTGYYTQFWVEDESLKYQLYVDKYGGQGYPGWSPFQTAIN